MNRTISDLLELRAPPVAVAFRDAAPAGLPRVATPGPSGCSYWKLAAEERRSFYTEADDHLNCPIGAHTHGVDLSLAKLEELKVLAGIMASIGYIDPAELPAIPRRAARFGVALYGPYPGAPFEPDVVLVRCDARRAMLLAEAIRAAGGAAAAPAMSAMLRPTCALIPESLRTGEAGLSLGCIGNRVYTGLDDGELYVAIPGARLAAVETKLATIVAANRELARFHESRRAQCGSPKA